MNAEFVWKSTTARLDLLYSNDVVPIARVVGLFAMYVSYKATDEDRANSAYWQQAHGKGH